MLPVFVGQAFCAAAVQIQWYRVQYGQYFQVVGGKDEIYKP